MTNRTQVPKEIVIREFPPMGSKYRVRVVENERNHQRVLDIREFISSESFTGYTRRGIRLADRAQLDLLRDVLKEILESMLI